MLTRRIVISACALCLAIPAAAGASPATDASTPVKATDPPTLVKAKGPYGTTTTDPPNLVKAIGPYGTTTKGPQDATPSTPHAVSASSNDGGDSWRTAAITGALLAALALGSALLLSARPRAEHLGT